MIDRCEAVECAPNQAWHVFYVPTQDLECKLNIIHRQGGNVKQLQYCGSGTGSYWAGIAGWIVVVYREIDNEVQ